MQGLDYSGRHKTEARPVLEPRQNNQLTPKGIMMSMTYDQYDHQEAVEDRLLKELGRTPTKKEVSATMNAELAQSRYHNNRVTCGLSKLDVHILLDAYYTLNGDRDYDPELDETIQNIAKNWNYKRTTEGQ